MKKAFRALMMCMSMFCAIPCPYHGWDEEARPLMTLLSNLGYVTVCVMGAIMVLNGKITYGVIIAFVLYVRMFTMPLSMVAQAMTSLQLLHIICLIQPI